MTTASIATRWPRQQMLAVAAASPAAVARHDKDAWLGLFAPQAVVEDPVGTAPHDSPQAIERFYETFIAPNAISFTVNGDYLGDDTVVRDVVIRTEMASGALIDVPTHIAYRLVEQQGRLQVAHLAAHWELRQMVPLVLKQGRRGLQTMLALSARMLRLQGLGGCMAYSRGMLQGIFQQAHADVAALLQADCNFDNERLAADFAGVEWVGANNRQSSEQFRRQWAGHLRVSQINAAGFSASFVYAGERIRGVGFLEYDAITRRVKRLRMFQ